MARSRAPPLSPPNAHNIGGHLALSHLPVPHGRQHAVAPPSGTAALMPRPPFTVCVTVVVVVEATTYRGVHLCVCVHT